MIRALGNIPFMNVRVTLPSCVNEGENLPLAASLACSGMSAPLLECGFSATDCRFELRRADEGWQGVANVHSGLVGHAFLKFRLSDQSRPGCEWHGEVSVRFASRKQVTPIHLTGVSNQGEKSGMGQAARVDITVNGLGGNADHAPADPSWQSVDLALTECDAPVRIPATPLPAPAVPPTRSASQSANTPPPAPVTGQSDSGAPSAAIAPKSNGWDKKLIVNVAGILAAIFGLLFFYSNKVMNKKEKDGQTIIINNNGNNNSIANQNQSPDASVESSDGSVASATHIPSNDSPVRQNHENSAPTVSGTGQETAADPIEVDGVRETYRVGEFLVFRVKLSQSGYVRVMADVLNPAKETVTPTWLYPSKRDEEKQLTAGQWHQIPDPDTLARFNNYGFPCLLPQGVGRENTKVVIQYSPIPFTKEGTTDDGVFYQYATPSTWQVVKSRGVTTSAGVATAAARELTFEVVKP
jgi:hypothetical protein